MDKREADLTRRLREDGHNAAKGIVVGLLVAAALWAGTALIVWKVIL